MPRKKQDKPTGSIKSSKGSTPDVILSHGRRKEAVARVRLLKGKGQVIVNEKPIDQYFPGAVAQVKWHKPFTLTKSDGQYYATIKVEGSGKSAQLDAVIHGLSRALSLTNPNFRPTLKKAGFLTRDARSKERR